MNRITLIARTSLIAAAIALTTGAMAQTVAPPAGGKASWNAKHPRRAEVNGRLANQNKRIHNEFKEGEISKSRAAALHKDDHQIRQEERLMASQNGGHITKGEQRTLNQQENAVSRQIGK